MSQGLQIAGALAVVSAFIAAQLHVLTVTSFAYLALNLAGSATLAVLAASGHQWGFLLLEGTWAAVSLGAIIRRWSRSEQVAGEPRLQSRPGQLDRR